jgi:hypothetical protein
VHERRKLTDILRGTDRDELARAWDQTAAAADLAPLPKGQYVAAILSGEPFTSRTGTPGYKLAFQVVEGEYAGRRFWHDLWLTTAALPMTKRDLGKLGVSRLDQLERPLPMGIRCQVRLTLQRGDDGSERNRVQSFDVVGTDPPDPFAPAAGAAGGDTAAHAGRGDAWEPLADRLPLGPSADGAGPYDAAGGRR